MRLSVTAGSMAMAFGVVAGCDAAGADAGARPASTDTAAVSAPGDGSEAAATASDDWATRTASGVPVRVRPQVLPLRPGTVHFRIEVPAGAAEASSLSADLVSPTMPMHGIRRFPVEREAEGVYLTQVEIPMEGEWMLYVNLDAGTDAASFEFAVSAADTTGADGSHGEHAH